MILTEKGGVSPPTFFFLFGTDYTDVTDKINKKTVKICVIRA